MTDRPAHLIDARQQQGRTYGSLRFADGHWVIDAEPQVVELAKRLFPGSMAAAGKAVFTVTKRLVPDINWLMLRYPLAIDCAEKWDAAFREAVEYTLRTRSFDERAVAAEPREFAGELLPFQKHGLAFLLHHRRTLLADEAGLGKTPQFLAFLAAASAYPCLICVQPHLQHQWLKAIDQFIPGLAVHRITGLTPYSLPSTPAYLIHYGILRGWKNALGQFACVCFDEIQELRRTGSQKYSAASLVAGEAESVFGLSGTPIHNAGGEIWAVLNILELHCLGDWDGFTREWCGGYGCSNVLKPDVLGQRLRDEGLMLRRRKDDVLKELPPKRRVIEEIDADSGDFDELLAEAVALAQAASKAKTQADRMNLEERAVNSARQATGIAKAPHVARFVEALLEAGETVLLFAYHHAVVDVLKDALVNFHPAVITGRESMKEKNLSQERFQDGRTPACIISLRSSAGLNLQKARCVVFAELDWSPAVHTQAEDRAHRIGQADSVLAYYLVWLGRLSSDPDMLDRLGFKTSQFVGLMGDRVKDERDELLATESARAHMQRIVARLREAGRTNVSTRRT